MPRASKSQATRERLIAAAREALLDGDGDFEMSELARRAGVSNGLPYHYFGSKAGALSALIDDFYDRQIAIVAQDPPTGPGWAESEFVRFQTWIAFFYEEPVSRLILGAMGRSVEVAELAERRQSELIELASANIEAGQRSGEIPESIDPAVAGAAVCGLLRQNMLEAFRRSKRPDIDRFATQLWDFIAGGLRLHEAVA